jgi:hypothetical protein
MPLYLLAFSVGSVQISELHNLTGAKVGDCLEQRPSAPFGEIAMEVRLVAACQRFLLFSGLSLD